MSRAGVFRKFGRDELCAGFLRSQILRYGNENASSEAHGNKERLLGVCREYFLETLLPWKSADVARQELAIVRDGEVRTVSSWFGGD